MFYNLKIAIRNLHKNGLYSMINLIGMSIGLVACTFIFLWAQDEKSYDQFHQNPKDIYQVITHFKSDGGTESMDLAPGLIGPFFEQNFPEVESSCRIYETTRKYLMVGDLKTESKKLLFADSTFFSFFNFPVIGGNEQELSSTSNKAVISKSLSTELFRDENPIGKEIKIDGLSSVYVAGIMKDFPDNTSVPKADLICSFGIFAGSESQYILELLDSFGGCEYQTYLRIKPNADVSYLSQQATKRQVDNYLNTRSFTLQPLIDRHLYKMNGEPDGIKTVSLFQWIAIVIMGIACINYVNLITARSSKRQREISLKKILGARRKRLFTQLLSEAAILFLIAVLVSLLLSVLLLPGYNYLSGKSLSLHGFGIHVWFIYGTVFVLILLLAGLYPAWQLSSFKPIGEKLRVHKESFFRKTLVIFQFGSSVVLIVITIAMQAQINYIRKKDLGFDREYVFTCNLSMKNHYNAIKTELLKNAAIRDVSCGSGDIVEVQDSHFVSDWQGKSGNGSFNHGRIWVDSSFFKTMHMTFIEGGSFTLVPKEQFVINETAMKAMGMEKPAVGKWMVASGGIRGTIVGVVKDFNFADLHKEIEPMVMRYNTVGDLYVRTTAQDASKAIANVEKLWKQYNPDIPFTYNFLDDTFNRMYQSDIRFGRLFVIFSLVTIFVSCLGLFGLVTYIAETKTKEIGIRKVMGASVGNIVNMLSREFLITVVASISIAFPLAYYWINRMLQDYAYRIDINWWIFALAGLITAALTLITVGWQAIKSATANPVKSIKAE